jgi:MFS transporter, DHA1 family, multidrug resistance protein
MNKEPTREFIVLIALMTSFIALAIDAMLPALPLIASELGAKDPNDRQLVISAMFLGLAGGQLIYGPISDTTGRKPAVYAGFFIFIAGCFTSIFAQSFETMLIGRFLQGAGSAGPRIVSMAIVRDQYEGRSMARVMSLTTSLFILVPVFAPALGQAVMAVASWQWIFGIILALSLIAFAWFWLRMEESLPRERRYPLSARRIGGAMLEAASTRATLGYSLAAGLVFGALVGYLNTSQQLFAELYGLGGWFPVVFGFLAVFIGVSSFINAKLVMRYGMRLLSRRALWLFTGSSMAFALFAWWAGGKPPVALLVAWLAITFAALGLLFSNFNALSMEPVGHIAGAAAAFVGGLTTVMSAVLGGLVGRAYDGTVIPMAVAYALLGLAAMAVTAWTEHRSA